MQAMFADRALQDSASSAHSRFDLYRDIHKALRAAMTDTLVRVGATDASDATELAETLATVRTLTDLCAHHVEIENTFVHPAIEARAPRASERIGGEHDHHLLAIMDLEEDVAVVEAAVPAGRATALLRLYHHLSSFVAENFEHMLVEETVHNAALWACYSDAELMALEETIRGSIGPDEMMVFLRWIVPSITAVERAHLFAGMRAAMPPPSFAGAYAALTATLSTRDVAKLEQALAA
jgi:hypothetical protein